MEPTLKWLKPEVIVTNWDMNPRERDEEHVLTLARHMNENGYDDAFPIIIYNIEEGPIHQALEFAATGYHRLAAAKLRHTDYPNLPLTEVYCEMRTGTMEDVIITMMTDNWQWSPIANRKIGKMPSISEIQFMRYRLMLFPDNFKKGDRLLAKEWNCSQTPIGTIRRQIIDELQKDTELSIPYFSQEASEKIRSIIERDMYVGLDGIERPRTKGESNEQLTLPGMSELDNLKTEWTRIDSMIKQAINALGFENLIQTYCKRRFNAPRHNFTWEEKDYKKGIKDGTAFLKSITEPVAESLMELMIEELKTHNEAIEVYKPLRKELSRPFLYAQAENAAKEFDNIKSADWEAKERPQRIKQLRSLITRFDKLYKGELKARKDAEKAKADIELNRTRDATEEARVAMWIAFDAAGLEKHVTKLDFAQAACEIQGLTLSEQYESPDNVLLGKDFARVDHLPLKQALRFRSIFEGITAAINNKAEWVQQLLPRPAEALKSLKMSLSVNGNINSAMDEIECIETYKITSNQYSQLKQQAIEEMCAQLRTIMKQIRKDAHDFFTEHGKELDSVGWDGIWRAALTQPQFDDLTEETFTGAHDANDFNDYKVLQRDINALRRLESDVRMWKGRNWIKALLPTSVLDDEADYPRINCINIFIEKDGKEVAFYFYSDELKDDDDRPLTDIPKQILDQLLNLVRNLEGKDDE